MKTIYNFTALILLLFCQSVYSQALLIPEGSSWKYYDSGDVGSPNWNQPTFNDNSWNNGVAELGYGDGDEATVVGFGGDPANKHITTYFRKTTTLPAQTSLNCRVKADDGVVVYLNGNEVFRAGMPTGAITFSMLAAASNENTWFNFTIPLLSTVAGANTFAVEVHQVSAGSSDMTFELEATMLVPVSTGLFINELMASNDKTAFDQAGSSSDWVEIFNNTGGSVDLGGYFLSDDSTDLTKHQITGSIIIPNGSRTILWANGSPEVGNNQLDFGLSAGGEWFGITHPDSSTIVDSVSFKSQKTDVSFGRQTDGSNNWRYFKPASFNATNLSSNSYLGFLNPPVFSDQGGFYTQPVSLTITPDDPSEVVLYSVDGSLPDVESIGGRNFPYRNAFQGSFFQGSVSTFTYQGTPIAIADRSADPNSVSLKAPSYTREYIPNGLISKSTVVKAISTKTGFLPSEPAVGTFFVYDSLTRYPLPVVSFATSEDNLFDYNYGNYTPGVLGTFNYDFCVPGNFSENYEYDASFEYFEAGQRVVNQNVRYRIHGGCSRSASRKSLRIYSPDDFNYGFFSNDRSIIPRRIILRNSGNDYDVTMFKDAAVQQIAKGLNCGIQEWEPTVVFINGEYWGLHNIRERYDKYYLEQKFGIDRDAIDMLDFSPLDIDEGTADDYNETLSFLTNTSSFSGQSTIDSLAKRIDFNSLKDYYIYQTFANHSDWVTNNNNNIALWRTRYEGTKATEDKKWRWLLKDLDLGFQNVDLGGQPFNCLAEVLDSATSFSVWIRKPLTNTEFKYSFINRYADLLNTHLLASNTTETIDQLENKIRPEIPEHINRWIIPRSLAQWESNVQEMKTFLANRPAIIRDEIKTLLATGNLYTLTADVSDAASGFITVNTIAILPSTPGVTNTPYPWSGKYFGGVPITLNATAQSGFKFKHWLHNGVQLSDSTITINPLGDVTYSAVFEVNTDSAAPYPTAFQMTKCGYEFTAWLPESAAGSTPLNMAFVYMDEEDPSLTAAIEGFTDGPFNYTNRTRINGLAGNGISFINTGNEWPGYPSTKLGGAILAFSTTGLGDIDLSFTAGTARANSREYNLRLQYRTNETQPFQDILDDLGQIVEYSRSAVNGDEQVFELALPNALMQKPYVQLLWRYYYTGIRNNPSSGARDEIRLDDIKLRSKLIIDQPVVNSGVFDNFGTIEGKSSLSTAINLSLDAPHSILLTPGFTAGNGTIFQATISGCQ